VKYTVARSRDVARDLALIFDFLVASFEAFGETHETARERGAERIRAIDKSISSLGAVPHQGMLREDIRAGLRSVTKDRAVFYFRVDDERRVVRVLAVFFGGQDHQRRMLRRLLV
jgi:plasmid stabilization system protein ParE